MAELNSTILVSDAQLKFYYRLENTSPTVGANTLTNNNTVAFNAAKFGNGADGSAANTNKSLTYIGDMGIDLAAAFTLHFWVKILAEPGTGVIYRLLDVRNTAGDDRYALVQYVNAAGTKSLVFNLSSGTNASYTVNLGTAVFHMVTITCTTPGVTQIYLDGVAVGTAGTRGVDTIPTAGIGILSDTTNASQWASAIMDDTAGFQKVLTQTEIDTLYNPLAPSSMFLMF